MDLGEPAQPKYSTVAENFVCRLMLTGAIGSG